MRSAGLFVFAVLVAAWLAFTVHAFVSLTISSTPGVPGGLPGVEATTRGASVTGTSRVLSGPKDAHDATHSGRGVPAPAPRPAPSRADRDRPGTALLNWPALIHCESSGNPRAVSPTGRYRGLLQFSLSTWRSVGGTGDPIDASPREQLLRGRLLFARSGAAPWPECGRLLWSGR